MDWFIHPAWLADFRTKLIRAREFHRLWSAAAEFFHINVPGITIFDKARLLIDSGLSSDLPAQLLECDSRYCISRLVVSLEDLEAVYCGLARFLMHHVVDHVSSILGIDPPHFGVDHTLMGCFFSMGDDSVPLAELERHGIPLYGIVMLKGTSNLPGLSTESTNHPRQDDDSLVIWLMRKAETILRPSPWYIKANPVAPNNSLHEIYYGLFGDAGPRDVDSVMAKSLSCVLGPGSTSSTDTVLPPSSLLPIALDNDDEGSVVADEWDHTLQRRKALVASAKNDPDWDSVNTDLLVAIAPDPPSAEHGRILSIVIAAQQKKKIYRSDLEKYVLAVWSEQHRQHHILQN